MGRGVKGSGWGAGGELGAVGPDHDEVVGFADEVPAGLVDEGVVVTA